MTTTTTTTTYELKNVKICEWASQETTCFTATLYINGKRIGTCGNEGWGGCNHYDFDTSIITDYASDWLWTDYVSMCEQYGLDQRPRDEFHGDPDSLINALLDQHDLAKQVKSYITKTRKKYRITNDTDLRVYMSGDALMAAIVGTDSEAKILAKYPDATIAPTTATITI